MPIQPGMRFIKIRDNWINLDLVARIRYDKYGVGGDSPRYLSFVSASGVTLVTFGYTRTGTIVASEPTDYKCLCRVTKDEFQIIFDIFQELGFAIGV